MAPAPGNRINGATVRRLRIEHDLTQDQLVRLCQAAAKELDLVETGLTVQRVSKWENGHSGIGRTHARLLEYVFARMVEGDDDTFSHDVNRRAFLLGSTATVTLAALGNLGDEPWQRLVSTLGGRSRIDVATVDGLAELNLSLGRMFQPVAPQHLLGPVRSHIDTLTDLLRSADLTGSLRQRLTSLAAEMSILMGWLSKEEGDYFTAQQSFTAGLTAAVDAEDHDLGAYAIASASTLPAFRSSPQQSLALLESESVRGARLDRARPSTKLWISVLQAEVHTRVGNETEAFGALDQADTILTQVDPNDGPRPLLGHFDEASLMGERGITAVRLQQPADAEPALDHALANMADYPKTQSRLLTNAARAHLQQGRIDQACSAALRSLDVALQTGSGVGVADVRELRVDLQPHASTDAVRELDEALAVQL